MFELAFGDGVFWISRIPPPSGLGFSMSIEEMRTETATVNVVKRHSTLPLPGFYGHDLSRERDGTGRGRRSPRFKESIH